MEQLKARILEKALCSLAPLKVKGCGGLSWLTPPACVLESCRVLLERTEEGRAEPRVRERAFTLPLVTVLPSAEFVPTFSIM